MSLNVILDVTIGLVTMYLVLSLACTSINEWISSFFKLRASGLRNALQKLIDDPTLRGTFNNHGLIAGAKKNQDSDPSYIAGPTFALALLDSLTPPGQVTTFPAAQAAAQALPPSHVRDVVLSNIALAAGDIDKLREGLSHSFDRAMDRVSGAYNRKIKWISLLVGIALATALNADSIAVAKALWIDKPRAEMLEVAKDTLSKDALSKEALSKDAPSKDAPSKDAAGTKKPETIDAKYRAVAQNVEDAANELRPLPIGWDFSPKPASSSPVSQPSPGSSERRWLDIVLKGLGLLLTGAALMFGAPFWFDVLSNIMNLRFAGKKPTRTAS